MDHIDEQAGRQNTSGSGSGQGKTVLRHGMFRYPDPLLDPRELRLIHELARRYARFFHAWPILRPAQTACRQLNRLLPFAPANFTHIAVEFLAQQKLVQRAAASARNTIVLASRRASRFTRTRTSTVNILRSANLDVDDFDEICGLRSYQIERVINRRNIGDLAIAAYEGAVTGAPGWPAVPINIALLSLLLFRAVQSLALYYGYDLRGEAGEMEFAAAVTLNCMARAPDPAADLLTSLIAKLMAAENIADVKNAVPAAAVDAARHGSLSILSTYMRMLITSGGRSAMESGLESIERPVFRYLMRQVTERIPAQMIQRVIPVVGAITGALSDTYYMRRVLRGANLIYHKRFILEKEERCARLLRRHGWRVT